MTETIQTAEREFKVIDESDEELLLKITSDLKKGMKVAVPKEDDQYSEDLESQAASLQVGQKIEATLISESEANSAWRFERIEER